MGCDIKILCEALARRLESYLPHLVDNDQKRFVKNRNGFHNIWHVVNILYEKHNFRDTAVLSLDARQAFGRIERGFLFNVLLRFGIGIEMDKALVYKPNH